MIVQRGWGGVIDEGYSNVIYGALIEMSNYYPQEKLMPREAGNPKVLRYSFWKRLMDDALNYGKKITEKGYKLCCQPTRVEQYNDKEFAELCKRFGELNPYGLYIVDTFGLLHENDLIRYSQIGHECLAPNVVLGYHAHDNMGQSFKNACTFLKQDFGNRIVQVDASIFGMGRGAGNLHLEQILEYLNHNYGTEYNLSPIYKVWDKHLSKMMKESPWGYNLAYFITAENSCNPNYASYYIKKGLSVSQIEKIIINIMGVDKYLYNDEKADLFMHRSI